MTNPQSEQEKNRLLQAVSRSFYFTIRALPPALRHPVRTAYLLARAADTIADTASLPVAERMKHLQSFRNIILGDQPVEDSAQIGIWMAPRQTNEAEKFLMTHLPEVLGDYAALDDADQADVQWVLDQITVGQSEDLITPALKDDAALERYTWLVAGCVGEFWTRIGTRKLPNYATLPEEEMIRLGSDFGKGLQLVNILRDLPEDTANGRSYLPNVKDFEVWHQRANALLANGWRYVLALRWWRLRFACALPVLIGWRTLALLGTTTPQTRIKVTRAEVRSILLQVALRSWSASALDSYRQKLLPNHSENQRAPER
ncbi:MAG TPA: squalene/phytoene synthase family protein [Chthoniobacterales bacterium]|jgi:farnesyl-diphosphate farnesyltransferase